MQNEIINKFKKISNFFILAFLISGNANNATINIETSNPSSSSNEPLISRGIYDEVQPSQINIETVRRAIERFQGVDSSSGYIETLSNQIRDAKDDFEQTGLPQKIDFSLNEFDGGDWYFKLDEDGDFSIAWEVQDWVPRLQELLFARNKLAEAKKEQINCKVQNSVATKKLFEFIKINGYNPWDFYNFKPSLETKPETSSLFEYNSILPFLVVKSLEDSLLSQANFKGGIPLSFFSPQLHGIIEEAFTEFKNGDIHIGYEYSESILSYVYKSKPLNERNRNLEFEFFNKFTKLFKLIHLTSLNQYQFEIIMPIEASYEDGYRSKHYPSDLRQYSSFIFSMEAEKNNAITSNLSLPNDAQQLLAECFVLYCREFGISLTKKMKKITNKFIKNGAKYRAIDQFLYRAHHDNQDEAAYFYNILRFVMKGYVFLKDWKALNEEILETKDDLRINLLREIINRRIKSFNDFLESKIGFDGTIGFSRLNKNFVRAASKDIFHRSPDGKLTNLPNQKVKKSIRLFNPDNPTLDSLIANFAVGEKFDFLIKARKILFTLLPELKDVLTSSGYK